MAVGSARRVKQIGDEAGGEIVYAEIAQILEGMHGFGAARAAHSRDKNKIVRIVLLKRRIHIGTHGFRLSLLRNQAMRPATENPFDSPRLQARPRPNISAKRRLAGLLTAKPPWRGVKACQRIASDGD